MSRKHLPFRPVLDALEGRVVLSTLTVANTLDSGPGSLRADIAAAHSGDTIAFGSGLKGQTIALTGGELLVNKSLIIQGPGAGLLAISGGNTSRVLEVAAGVKATLAGLTIEGGNGALTPDYNDGAGGAILNAGTLTVSGCTVSGNSANFYGGGIYNGGTLTVSGSTVSGNSAALGGGIYNEGTLTVSSSTVSSNSAGSGGGIYNDGTRTLTVSNSAISGNTAYSGGGIDNAFGGSASISGSTLSGNTGTGGPSGDDFDASPFASAGGGGGLWNAGTMTVSGTALTHNSAGTNGGALYNSGKLTLSSCTVSGNSAAIRGGGIFNDQESPETYGRPSVTLNNKTTVTQNTAIDGGGLYNGRLGDMTLEQTTVTQNTAVFGGGIYNAGFLTLEQTTVTQNTATWENNATWGPNYFSDGGYLTSKGSTIG